MTGARPISRVVGATTELENGRRKKKIRVLHVVTRWVRRGVPRHVLDIATHLNPDRFEVEVLAGRGDCWEGSLWEEAAEKGVTMHRVNSLQRPINPIKDVIAFCELYRRMRKGKHDVVHTHISKAGFLGRLAARCASVPVVVHTYHGCVAELSPKTVMGRLLTICERFAARVSDALVAVSAMEVRQKKAAGIGHGKQYHVIHAGIDLGRFQGKQNLRRPPSVEGEPVIGTIGTLTYEKGLDSLIEVLPAVLIHHPRLKLCIVGTGPMADALREQAKRIGVDHAVHFAGVAEDVRPWLSALDLLVQPSRSEGLALAVLEAMAMGVAVLATDVGGMAEAVEDGVNGRLVRAGEVGELADVLSALLSDRSALKELGRVAAQDVKRFSLERSVEELGALYEQLLSESPQSDGRVHAESEFLQTIAD